MLIRKLKQDIFGHTECGSFSHAFPLFEPTEEEANSASRLRDGSPL